MKKITNGYFNVMIKDILNFLSDYMDIKEIEEKYKRTKYSLVNKTVNKIEIYKDEFLNVKIPKYAGVTNISYLADEYSFVIVNPICLVRDNLEDQIELRNTMFHELIHVGSISQTLIDKDTLNVKIGLMDTIYKNSKKIVAKEKIKDMTFLNESMTELVAKFIYDKIYEEKYKIRSDKDDKVSDSVYARGYFLLAYLLLNYFEEHPKELFEIYFNNNLNLLEDILLKTWGLNLESLKGNINYVQKGRYKLKAHKDFLNIIYKIDQKNPIRNEDVRYQFNL